MTPEQRIKREILLDDAEQTGNVVEITAENVDEIYDKLLVQNGYHYDYESEFRYGQEETSVPCEYSRHYESKSVASKLSDGTWVGWTFWYGGGKHGEPEAIDWMGEAYELDVTEEEKIVTVRTFKKLDKEAVNA